MDMMAILSKIKENIFLIPEARFDDLTKDLNYVDSFIYLVVSALLYSVIAFPVALLSGVLNVAGTTKSAAAGVVGGPISALISTALVFVMLIVFRYVYIVVVHFLLKLVGGTAPLLKTAQVMIYGSTPMILAPIPCAGWIFSLIVLANTVVGAKRVHNISFLKAVVAMIVIPALVIGALLLALVAVIGVGVFSGIMAGLK